MSACLETKSHLSKTRKSFFFFCSSYRFFCILVVVELWPNRRLMRRTDRKKEKMNGVDTIRSREEPTSISCCEYESVHHLRKPKKIEEMNATRFTIGWLFEEKKRAISISWALIVYRKADIIRIDRIEYIYIHFPRTN
jgi:hypothetical protein